ncbi:MAG: hypothetical protein HKM07_01105, partial [Chlamydiae bacterium]|nr:hypothetical protein [Chlamydiota bacterium]
MEQMEQKRSHMGLVQTIYNPHHYLGLHDEGEEKVIRIWRPGADLLHIELLGKVCEMELVDSQGLFELKVPAEITFKDYKVYHQNGLLDHDPYAFLPTFSDFDSYLFSQGVHYQLYDFLG